MESDVPRSLDEPQRARRTLWLDADQARPTSSAPSYFRRELGLVPVTLEEIDFEVSAERPLLAFLHVEPEALRSLRDLPPRSVHLLVVSDETYRLDLLEAITRTPAIAHVFRCYPLFGGSRQPVPRRLAVAASELRGMDVGQVRPALRAVAAGSVLRRRVASWSRRLRISGIGVTSLCLGYTEWFEMGLNALAEEGLLPAVPEAGSLLPYLADAREQILANKTEHLGFVGQSGNFQRQAGIRSARQAGFNVGPVRDGFGGGSQDPVLASREHVGQLLSSRFTLCPPGNYSGESFRLTEACLMFSVPVEVTPTLSDPCRPAFGAVSAPGISGTSWAHTLRDTTEMGDLAWKQRADRSFQAVAAAFKLASDAVLTSA